MTDIATTALKVFGIDKGLNMNECIKQFLFDFLTMVMRCKR